VLDPTVNDFSGFKSISLKSLDSSQNIQENTSFKGFSRRPSRGTGNPNARSTSNSQSAKAEAFLGDPEIQDLFKVRRATTTSKLLLANGCT
jgi:hypothetical protein